MRKKKLNHDFARIGKQSLDTTANARLHNAILSLCPLRTLWLNPKSSFDINGLTCIDAALLFV